MKALTMTVAVLLVSACGGGSRDNPFNDDGGLSETGGEGGQALCDESRVGPPTLRRLTRHELENSLRDIFPDLGASWTGVELGTDPVSKLGFSNDGDTLLVGNQVAGEILETAEDVATILVAPGTFETFLPCSAAAADEACAQSMVETTGRRLFRRPLTDAEVQRYVDHWASIEAESDFVMASKWTLVALIESPHSVYRAELGEADGDGRALTQYEIASALAYTFGGTTPNEALLGKAAAGELTDPETLVDEARGLLATEQGQEVLRRFFEEWIRYRIVEGSVKNDVPEFESARVAMAGETRAFIDEVVLAQEGNVRDLLTSNITVLDEELVAFYGYGDVGVTTRPEEWGVGLLAQASLLAGNAHGDYSSPTLRGLLLTEKLFCRERPTPPPDVPALDPPEPGVKTTRERYEEAHAGDPACSICHTNFDPLGFAFEHFDATGRYRLDENGLEIDATGWYDVYVDELRLEFDGATDLAQQAAELPEVTDCVAGLIETYAYGGAAGESCLAGESRVALRDDEFGLAEYMAQLAGEPHFTRRE